MYKTSTAISTSMLVIVQFPFRFYKPHQNNKKKLFYPNKLDSQYDIALTFEAVVVADVAPHILDMS